MINKKKLSIFLALSICVICTQSLLAEEVVNSDEVIEELSNNVSEEYVTCAAYYSIASEAIRRSGDIKTAEKYEEAFESALQYALTAAKEGRTEEMAEKVTLARLNLNMKSMTKEIDNDIGNISVLMDKYADRCKEILENPDKIRAEWTDKILRKHNLK